MKIVMDFPNTAEEGARICRGISVDLLEYFKTAKILPENTRLIDANLVIDGWKTWLSNYPELIDQAEFCINQVPTVIDTGTEETADANA